MLNKKQKKLLKQIRKETVDGSMLEAIAKILDQHTKDIAELEEKARQRPRGGY